MSSAIAQRTTGPYGRFAEKTVDELYAEVPWYRRVDTYMYGRTIPVSIAKTIIWLLFFGILLPPFCLIVLTGPMYERKLVAPGQLKAWGWGNRVAAVVLLLLWIAWVSWKIMAFGESRAASHPASTLDQQPPMIRAGSAPPITPQLPPKPKPAVRYEATVDNVSQSGIVGDNESTSRATPSVHIDSPAIAPATVKVLAEGRFKVSYDDGWTRNFEVKDGAVTHLSFSKRDGRLNAVRIDGIHISPISDGSYRITYPDGNAYEIWKFGKDRIGVERWVNGRLETHGTLTITSIDPTTIFPGTRETGTTGR